jgi:predicted porin
LGSLFSQELKIDGTIHASLDAISYSDTKPNRDDLSVSLYSRYTNIGVTHSQNLAKDLSGYFRVSRNYIGTQGDYLIEDEYFLGVKSEQYGSFQVGQQDSPAYKLLKRINPLFNRVGSYKNITKGFSNINGKIHDKPYQDTATYLSPIYKNYQFEASIVTDQDSEIVDSNQTGNSNEPHAFGLYYKTEDTLIGATLTRLLHNAVTQAQTSLRLGVQQDFGNIRINGVYDYASDQNSDVSRAYLISLEYKQENIKYTGQINYGIDIDDGHRNGFITQLAIDFLLNNDSFLYFQVTRANIDETANFQYGQMNYDGDIAISVGFVYKFDTKLYLQ